MDDILDVLVAHGVPGSTIVRVAKLIADAAVTERIRVDARERMRRVRERSQTVPNVQNGSEQEPAYIEEKIKKKKESKKVSIAADWKPDEIDRAYARSKGWPDTRIEAEAERFHNHYLANGEARKSWPASWRKWVTSPFQKPDLVLVKSERQTFL